MSNPRASTTDIRQANPHGGLGAYSAKNTDYFAGARVDYVNAFPDNSSGSILEIGCGQGATGALALSLGKCGTYCGVEIYGKAAEIARSRITEVLVGNIEEQELPWPPARFDALVLSEVLEHLVDPWAVLRKLRPMLKSNAVIFASSPNASHYNVICMLLKGQWNLTDFGVMDRTHLRWFTPTSFRALFESCGYTVDSIGAVGSLSKKARAVSAISFGHLDHLFIGQIDLRAHCS